MIDITKALAGAAEQVHRTHCTVCEQNGDCGGFTDVDAGVAVAVIDTFLTLTYTDLRRLVWDAHREIFHKAAG